MKFTVPRIFTVNEQLLPVHSLMQSCLIQNLPSSIFGMVCPLVIFLELSCVMFYSAGMQGPSYGLAPFIVKLAVAGWLPDITIFVGYETHAALRSCG